MFKWHALVGYWLLIGLFAVGNAILAGLLIQPWAGEYATHVYKSLLGVAFVFFASWLYSRSTRGPATMKVAWTTGLLWLLMTIAFEFLAGHYAFGNSWEKLFADYRIWNGRLWALFLAATFFGPPAMAGLLAQAGKRAGW